MVPVVPALTLKSIPRLAPHPAPSETPVYSHPVSSRLLHGQPPRAARAVSPHSEFAPAN
jgi:hypothetical protein